jgi:hypothetical protein
MIGTRAGLADRASGRRELDMRTITWGAMALASVLISSGALAEDFAGEWHGVITADGQSLRVALHVKKTADSYAGTADSLDQGAMGLVLANIVTDGQSLSFSVNDTDGTYAGKWDAAKQQWVGTWTQGMALPLNLIRGPVTPP